MTLSSVKELDVGVSKPQLQKPRCLSKEEAAAVNNHYFHLRRPAPETGSTPVGNQIATWYLFCSQYPFQATLRLVECFERSYFLEESIRSI